MSVSHVLREAKLVPSAAEANRLIEQGGVKIDSEKVADKSQTLSVGQRIVAQVGKRKFAKIHLQKA
jgi:tyrosyl-tRNA synthetase